MRVKVCMSAQRRVYEAAQVRSSRACRGDISNHRRPPCESPGFLWQQLGNVGAADEQLWMAPYA